MRSEHLRIAGGILCGIAAAACLAGAEMLVRFDRLIVQSDTLIRAVSEHQPEAALRNGLNSLEQCWKDSRFWLEILIPNDTLSDLNGSIARLPAELSAGSDAFSADLAAVSADLKWLRRRQLPGISRLTGG